MKISWTQLCGILENLLYNNCDYKDNLLDDNKINFKPNEEYE